MTACGPLDGADRSGAGTGTTATSATDLTIEVAPEGDGGPKRTWTLACDPVGGSLPGAAKACSRLTREALRPLPRDAVCTQIYGGPQTAHVSGRLEGEPVDVEFSRSNGCEIHRWDSLRFLFPVRI